MGLLLEGSDFKHAKKVSFVLNMFACIKMFKHRLVEMSLYRMEVMCVRLWHSQMGLLLKPILSAIIVGYPVPIY